MDQTKNGSVSPCAENSLGTRQRIETWTHINRKVVYLLRMVVKSEIIAIFHVMSFSPPTIAACHFVIIWPRCRLGRAGDGGVMQISVWCLQSRHELRDSRVTRDT